MFRLEHLRLNVIVVIEVEGPNLLVLLFHELHAVLHLQFLILGEGQHVLFGSLRLSACRTHKLTVAFLFDLVVAFLK